MDRIQSTCIMCFQRDARNYDRGFPTCGMCEKDIRRVLEFLAYHARGDDDKPMDEAVTAAIAAQNGKVKVETTKAH